MIHYERGDEDDPLWDEWRSSEMTHYWRSGEMTHYWGGRSCAYNPLLQGWRDGENDPLWKGW